ncbi:MAG: hypothetical protein AMJ90_06130 [candidate division Zixibacteria bacterium SM23_73_2]|nr:MAG: hypothetical protein AMJ90_06130 [candidate division Zixibacteria bacterium SM23_73_2]
MYKDYETSRNALQELLKWYNSHVNNHNRNEATTRLHLIDDLIFKCLGWEKEDCVAEDTYENTYVDYSLSCPKRTLIIEAKREGIYFELPAGHLKIKYSIKHLCRDNPKISDAVKQAMNYCQERGTLILRE